MRRQMGVPVSLILFSFLFGLLLALLVSMLLVWGWTIVRIWGGRPLLNDVPSFPHREAPWGAPTVFLLICLYLLVNMAVVRFYAASTGRKPAHAVEAKAKDQAGPRLEAAKPNQGGTGGEEDEHEEPGVQTQTDLLLQLAMINGLLVLLVPCMMKYAAGAELSDLGLTLVDWRRQMAAGAAAALLATPAVYAIQSLAVRVWQSQDHPVQQMVLGRFSFGVALLAIVSTVVLAPLLEELLFRGIIQRWFTKLLGSRQTSGLPGPIDLGSGSVGGSSYEETTGSSARDDAPVRMDASFAAADPFEPSSGAVLPLVLTSLIFAALHFGQWPAPLAIFLLSMALGILYQCTGSLLAVVTMHATFNGFSTLLLLLEALSRQTQAHPAVVKALLVPTWIGDLAL
jgi:membrane protease YdiL (CAAX protease family)